MEEIRAIVLEYRAEIEKHKDNPLISYAVESELEGFRRGLSMVLSDEMIEKIFA